MPLWIGLVGSIFPDLDLLYFYLIDHRRTLHHRYWTHLPLVWIALGLLVVGGSRLFKAERLAQWSTVFVLNVLLHQTLDTIVGKVLWLAPFDTRVVYLFEVPAVHGHWLLNYLLHWSIAFEVLVWVAALLVWRSDGDCVGGSPPARSTPRAI